MFQHAYPPRWLWITAFTIVIVWYPALMCLLGFPPWGARDFGLVFNSMAEHLLSGRFDLDPDVIGAEGFDVNGRMVSYFGIFCALLRVPLVLIGFARIDVTWWSCLFAVWIATYFQLRAIALTWVARASSRRALLTAGLLISVILGGPHIQFLRPSIYQEPIDWASAQAMAFIFLTMRGFNTARGFDRSTLCWMALCAGLALLTRVSFGVGLYAAFGLFLLARGQWREWLAPASVLLTFVVLTGIVNDGRWGNPFTFADYSRFNLSQDVAPDRLGRLAAYGTFTPERIWLGLSYYFFPIWVWIRSDGHVLFAETQSPLMDSMELPPGSFFLTDPFLLGLASVGIWAVRDRTRAALLLGLCTQPLLMLCAISMTHRYRVEFYPMFFFAALLGVTVSTRTETTRSFRAAIIGTVIFGVAASHAMAVLDAISPAGPGEYYLERYGVVGAFTRQPRH